MTLAEQLLEVIKKVKGGYHLVSKYSKDNFLLHLNKINSTPSQDIWDLSDHNYPVAGDNIGFVVINKSATPPAVQDVQLDDTYLNQGLGKWMYKTLSLHYGGLQSDISGKTNHLAQRVWKSLKATEFKMDGETHYRLEK